MFADVRVVRCAGQVRWAGDIIAAVGAELVEVGREDLLFEVTNLELQLSELHGQLMKARVKVSPTPPEQKRARERREQRARLGHAVTP